MIATLSIKIGDEISQFGARQYLVLPSKHSAGGKLVLTVFGPGLTIRLILPAPVKTTDHKRRRRRLWRWRGPHLPW